MEEFNEDQMIGHPDTISYECTKKIIEQMERNICKIKLEKKEKQGGTGFFCKIPFPDKNNMLSVFITNNHLINENELYKSNTEKIKMYIEEENKERILNLKNRYKYTNSEYDTTIIEILEEDNINNYLELDDKIINDILNNRNENIKYLDKSIYIIQYPKGDLSVSYGIIKNIDDPEKGKNHHFNHNCTTTKGSSGSPILNLNNKLIGIHKGGSSKNNIGKFLNFPIKDFIQRYINNQNSLKEFNEKFDTNIIDTKIDEINFDSKDAGEETLKYLSKIEFTDLKKLYLKEGEIFNIKLLKDSKFEFLEILNLSRNKISDINILENVNLRELKELNLSRNTISDINVLEKVKFEKLEKLNLKDNEITDINVLEKVNFKELKKLNLKGNKISDINALEKAKFEKFEKLNLRYNEITDINVLEKVNFKELKKLNLSIN